MESTGVIIVAGGSGSRMGAAQPKQFLMIDNQPILAHTINNFHEALPEAKIVVVLPSTHIDYWNNLCSRFDVAKHRVVAGGENRFYSVKNGLEALDDDIAIIAVHDGVRPLFSSELIKRGYECAELHDAAIPVVEVVDSYRVLDGDDSQIVDRSKLRIVQTPQFFRYEVLRPAYKQPFDERFTDDGSVVESYGCKVTMFEGENENIKITTPEQLLFAQMIIEKRYESREIED